ncbi:MULTISPECIES: AAA family ATPase [Bacillus cereus group]|uniref:AAA family ATPase n=1 Tax=Bacillus cereus group TaxID=86661 RepID=UPI0024BCFB2F|nr:MULTISPECIES: AAA family ATPase [Bacillus cereus group]MED3396728.1 AAA family ATPase [Bacillus wiedmannii]
MQENKLSLQFKDNKKKIEFDLNQNTVFFGNNGQGKTRILKTINSLYILAKEKKTRNLSKIIDSMNLEELKINNVSFNKLFSSNENLKRTETHNLTLYVKENIDYFNRLELLLQEIPNDDIISVINRPHYNRIMGYLRTSINRIAKKELLPHQEGFDRWMNDIYHLISRLRNNKQHMLDFEPIEFERFDLINIEEAYEIISYLKEKHHFLIINTDNEKLISHIEQNKENILKGLSIKSAHYITTDNIEIMKINKVIESTINEINNELENYFWCKSTNLYNLDSLEPLIAKRNELYLKIESFNEVIGKYADIEVKIQNNNELVFIKNTEEMAFDKLSSGERKLSFLFLEILLNDVDIYLIDEPELSLSLNFQNRIITDLHILTPKKTLFIATHAPYIYEDFIAIEGNISKEV